LEVEPVVRHLVAQPVDQHVVPRLEDFRRVADLRQLRVVAGVLVHLGDEGVRAGRLHPGDDADLVGHGRFSRVAPAQRGPEGAPAVPETLSRIEPLALSRVLALKSGAYRERPRPPPREGTGRTPACPARAG